MTAPWLAPDGEEWFPPYRPVTCPWLGRSYARRRRTFLAAGQYRRWLWQAIQADPGMADAVRQLHGRDLCCCCCAPAACHGDVLVAAAAWLSRPAVVE